MAVRRWSQYIWDAVEAGHIRWSDKEVIQEERVRMCLTAPPVLNNYNNSSHYGNATSHRRTPGMQEVVCRQFNTRMGCNYRESHVDGAVFANHICTYCDSIGRVCYHSVRECERRVMHSRQPNDMGTQHRGRSFHNNNNQQNGQYNSHGSKNGYQAPV